MGLFFKDRNKPKVEVRDALIEAILNSELERRKAESLVATQKLQNDLRQMELEHEHIEEIAEQKRKDRRDALELRELRQKNAANARAVLAAKRAEPAPNQGQLGCRVCSNQSDPTLSANEIFWHANGHPPQASN